MVHKEENKYSGQPWLAKCYSRSGFAPANVIIIMIKSPPYQTSHSSVGKWTLNKIYSVSTEEVWREMKMQETGSRWSRKASQSKQHSSKGLKKGEEGGLQMSGG